MPRRAARARARPTTTTTILEGTNASTKLNGSPRQLYGAVVQLYGDVVSRTPRRGGFK